VIRREDGFTLVELMIAITLMVLIMGTAFAGLQQFETTSARNTHQNEAQDNARNAIDVIVKRLRNDASPTPGSPQAIERATGTDLIFQTVDPAAPAAGSANSHNVMRVRYCLDDSAPGNERLYFQQQKWTTAATPPPTSSGFCPDTTSGTWLGQPRVMTDHVTNNYSSTPRALWKLDCPSGYSAAVCATGTDPSMLSRVKRIAITMFVDQDAARDPAESRLTTAVYFRNQNAKPAATMSQPTTGAGDHVYANASASSDPDADRLYYRWCWFGTAVPDQGAPWCQGGTELIDRSMSLDYIATGAHGPVWLGLRVQDTGGLVAYDYKSVTLP
jgi:prepilin-type N-terminal cleavage/methylation domain-containing protein